MSLDSDTPPQDINVKLLSEDALEQANKLVDYLEGGDVDSARQIIISLNNIREDGLYQELGKLTRELHESLKQIDVGINEKAIPTARSRLSYVIKMTEDAANKTMDKIESTIPISDELANNAKALLDTWSKFRRRELTLQQFTELYNEMMKFLEDVKETAHSIHGNLQDILVAQNYQDLTGQAIKKVITTVSSLEEQLVALVRVAAAANKSVGSEEEVNTLIEPKFDPGSERIEDQASVDDILREHGF